VSATKQAEKFAAQKGVDLADVKPSGDKIGKQDVLAYLKAREVTETEARLLLYPPTESTWLCSCDQPIKGSAEKCYFCGKKKPKKVKLLWPQYVKACKKVGIDPGLSWKRREDGTVLIRQKGTAWKILDAH